MILQVQKETVEDLDVLDVPGPMDIVSWSPHGTYFVIGALGAEGALMFCSMQPETNKLEILHKDEHFMLNELLWDPSGRYLATTTVVPIVTSQATQAAMRYASEAGYSDLTHTHQFEYFSFFNLRDK